MPQRITLVHGYARKCNLSKPCYMSLSIALYSDNLYPFIEVFKSPDKMQLNGCMKSEPIFQEKSIIRRSSSSIFSSLYKSLRSLNSGSSSSVDTSSISSKPFKLNRKVIHLDELFHVNFLQRKNKTPFLKSILRGGHKRRVSNPSELITSPKKTHLENSDSNQDSINQVELVALDGGDITSPTDTLIICCQSHPALVFTFLSIESSVEWYKNLFAIVERHQSTHSFPKLDAVWYTQMRIKSRRSEDPGLTNTTKPDNSSSSRYRVYLCFTREEILIVKNSVRHPEYLIEYPFVRQSGTRPDGVFELHLGRASPLGECEIHFKMHDMLEARQVHSEYDRILSIRCKLLQQAGVKSRKRTFKNSFKKRSEADFSIRSGELGPSLPMPKLLDCFDKRSDSESSISKRLPPKKFIEDSNVSVGTLASNLSKQCNLDDHMCPPHRRVTLSSCAEKAKQNLYTNLKPMVSKSVPTATVFKRFHPPEPAASAVDNGSEMSSDFPTTNTPRTTCPSLELLTDSLISSCSAQNEEENTATTLVPIKESGDKTQASYVDVNEISTDAHIVLNREEILKQPPAKGPLELDTYTQMLADHESNMLATEDSRKHTPRSSLSTVSATFSSSEAPQLLTGSSNNNSGLPGLPPDKNTIMWVLSYLIATNSKRGTAELSKQVSTHLPSNVASLMKEIEHSGTIHSLIPQAQKRAASFNASPSEILRNLQNKSDPVLPSQEEVGVRDNRPLHSKLQENKRVTVGACSKPSEFRFPQKERRSSINHINLQTAHQGELACRILGANELNQNNLFSSGSSSSPRQYSSRGSSLSIKQNTKRNLGNQANDDLFATVSFEPQSNYAYSQKIEFMPNSRSRTSSDAIIYRRKLNTLTHTLLRHSLFNDQNKALSAVRELISQGEDSTYTGPEMQTMDFGNQGNQNRSKTDQSKGGSTSVTNSARDSVCSDSLSSQPMSETFDDLLGPASMHYGLTTRSKKVLNLPISSLYDEILIESVQDCTSSEQPLERQSSSKSQAPTTR